MNEPIVSLTFQQLIFRGLDRIISLSAGETTSYNPQAHESCLNTMWFMIPPKEKESGERNFDIEWKQVEEEYSVGKILALPSKEERDAFRQTRINEKMRIFIECINELDLIFDGPDARKQHLWDAGR